jgi:hypothetical protein
MVFKIELILIIRLRDWYTRLLYFLRNMTLSYNLVKHIESEELE